MWSRITWSNIMRSNEKTESPMKRGTISCTMRFAMVTLFVSLTPANANAVEMGALLTIPSLFNEITLLAAIIAFFGGLKVYGLVKGGLLAKCWQMFLYGFGALTLAQVLRLLNTLGLVEIPEMLTSLLLGFMAVLWLLGIREARKALGA